MDCNNNKILSKFFRRLLGFGRSEQEKEQKQEQYVDIGECLGSKGRLFFAYVVNKQGIEGGGLTSCLLVRGADGKFRPPTDEELGEISRGMIEQINWWAESREKKGK